MKRKGFTLIELLAVIVILAVISLIAVPMILGVIEIAKENAAKSSALGYIDAVEKQIVKNNLDLFNAPITDGVYETDDLNSATYGVTVKGNRPETTSWVKIEKNQVVSYSFKIGEYIVSCDELTKDTVVSKGDTILEKPTGAPISFSSDSWSTIQTAVNSGKYPYQVGDTKTVDMGDLGIHTVRVANITSCTNGEISETACGFVVEFADIITTHEINSSFSSEGGWPSSEMRSYLNTAVLNVLPGDLQNVIIDTTVVSSYGVAKENFTSTDKLYLLSTKEVWNGGTGTDTAESETRQLDYYKQLGVTISNSLGAIKQNGEINSYWWLRSVKSGSIFWSYVNRGGEWYYENASYAYGVSPAFRIG